MSTPTPQRTTVSSNGSVSIRQRPALLLMKLRMRVTEATLELGLAKLKSQSEGAAHWLKRLGATRVEFGEPHFDDQTDKDPMARARADAAKVMQKRGGTATETRERGVNVVATAFWSVATLSPDETLMLLDRLKFEATEDPGPAEAAEETPAWESPAEQIRDMMMKMHQPPPDDRAPQFLFIFRLSPEQWQKAEAEAFSLARQNAERLARAVGQRLGTLGSLNSSSTRLTSGRTDRMMERQRCGTMLAGSSYDLAEDEVVSDNPRATEFGIQVHVSYSLE